MKIASVGRALAPHYYDQETLLAAFARHWGKRHHNLDRLVSLHRKVLVGGRHLALEMEAYERLESWGQANDAWIQVALDMGERALKDALNNLTVDDIDALTFVTVTGVATPSIDARLVNRMGLPQRIRRMPIFGLGCVAGAAGISRTSDYVRAWPGQVAVLLSVELCSLTLQRDDLSIPNLISTGLFGDGAAAAVLVGDQHPLADTPGPRVVATRSIFYPDTERVMGWDISETGFKVVLSAEVPSLVRERLGPDVDAFLAECDLRRSDISAWVCHPGGPKVLEAMQDTLGLREEDLALTWKTLSELGNLSSTSILMVLAEVMEEGREPGEWGLMIAMGPGFCSELVLLQW